jgi:hypothetical protein
MQHDQLAHQLVQAAGLEPVGQDELAEGGVGGAVVGRR